MTKRSETFKQLERDHNRCLGCWKALFYPSSSFPAKNLNHQPVMNLLHGVTGCPLSPPECYVMMQ